MSIYIKIGIIAIASVFLLWISWSSLRNVRKHGFYRFFAFETTLLLIILNLDNWFQDPFSLHQIISWSLLIVSIFLAIFSFVLLKKIGRSGSERNDPALVGFEKTTRLVKRGVYRYIRHPMYSSLLFLTWGAFFKNPSKSGAVLALISMLFLILTARKEEMENIAFFGEEYKEYIRQTRMFIPFLF